MGEGGWTSKFMEETYNQIWCNQGSTPLAPRFCRKNIPFFVSSSSSRPQMYGIFVISLKH